MPGMLSLLFAAALAAAQTSPTVAAPQQGLPGWVSLPTNAALTLVGGGEPSTPLTSTVVVQNTSSKTITAFSVSFMENSGHLIDFLEGGKALQPRARYTIPVGNDELSDPNRVMRVLAVVFDDGSAEGDQPAIDFIHARRLGLILEAKRVQELLDSLGSNVHDTSLTALEDQLGGLPESVAEALSSLKGIHTQGVDLNALGSADPGVAQAFVSGVRHARQNALWKVCDLNQLPEPSTSPAARNLRDSNPEDFLAEWRQSERTRAARYQAYLEAAWRKEALE